MCNGKIRVLYAACLGLFLTSLPGLSVAETNQEMETWSYHQDFDKSTNLNFSYARSPIPKLNLYDNIRLEFICKDNKLQWITQASSLITSQGREFEFEYEIDKKPPVKVNFRTFKDNKRRGYSEDGTDKIARAFLNGQSVFVRVSTIINTVLSAEISLKNAAGPIQNVLNDCGIAQQAPAAEQQPYTLADFEKAFAKLSGEQQTKILDDIRKIMDVTQ